MLLPLLGRRLLAAGLADRVCARLDPCAEFNENALHCERREVGAHMRNSTQKWNSPRKALVTSL